MSFAKIVVENVKLTNYRLLSKTNPSKLDGWWWCLDETLDTIGELLNLDRYVLIDDFLSINEATVLRKEILQSQRLGLLSSPGVIGGYYLGFSRFINCNDRRFNWRYEFSFIRFNG